MSVPVLLTGLETIATPPLTAALTPPSTPPLEEDAESDHLPTIRSAALPRAKCLRNFTQLSVVDEKPMCALNYRPFTVQLSMDLEPNELVAVTGNTVPLGEWHLHRAVSLRPFGHKQWAANVPVHLCQDIRYRYFTYVLDARGCRQIRRWESDLQPRLLKRCTRNNCRLVDRFGETENGAIQLRHGWLTNGTIVQLKFNQQRMFQLREVDKFDPQHLLIKLVPLCENNCDDLGEGKSLCIEVASLKYGESQLRPQQESGIEYESGDVVIFHLTLSRPMKFAYALIFYTPQEQPIGRAVIKSEQLHGSEGELILNVTAPEEGGDMQPLAQLTLPYLVVQPMEQMQFDFHTSYAHYWPKSWPSLDVGHRGMGRSYIAQDAPNQLENTIASFLEAYEFHTDMIELDVHLTADGVPIIWHDFSVKTAPHGKKVSTPKDLEAVLVKNLSYKQLKELRVFAVINNEVKEYPSHNAEPRFEHRIFPPLLDVLKALPPSLGIDVEIKWPQRLEGGGVEAEQTIDKNFFVDRILQTVLQHGCGRPLIFSSFDADICTMLRFKQNLLPVMFLTMGRTRKWKPFMDLRTRTFEQAVNFAQALELVGTAPHAEDFVGEDGAHLMQLAHKLDQIAVVWGEDCNSRERVKYFSRLGAAAICYDRTDLHLAPDKESSFFDTAHSRRLFEGQCRN